MIYTTEVMHQCPVAKGAYHGPAPIPEEGKWVQVKDTVFAALRLITAIVFILIHINAPPLPS